MSEKIGKLSFPKKADERQELSPTIIVVRLIRVLSEVSQPLHWQDICMLVETDNLGRVSISGVKSSLSRMCYENLLIRIEQDVYSLPEFADKEYELPQKIITTRDRVSAVFEQSDRPLSLHNIYMLAMTDGLGYISDASVSGLAGEMCRKNLLVRVDRGVYSLPEFAQKEYELPRITIDKRINIILKQAGRPLHCQEIKLLAESDGYDPQY